MRAGESSRGVAIRGWQGLVIEGALRLPVANCRRVCGRGEDAADNPQQPVDGEAGRGARFKLVRPPGRRRICGRRDLHTRAAGSIR